MMTIDEKDSSVANLTAIVYNSVHAMLQKDKLDPVQFAIALTCASRMLFNDFVEKEEIPHFIEYANNLLIDYDKITKH